MRKTVSEENRPSAPQGFRSLILSQMKVKDIKLKELSLKTKLSISYLSRLLAGGRGVPTDEKIIKIAEALDIQPPDLLLVEAGRVDEKTREALLKPLFKAAGDLSPSEMDKVYKSMQAIISKHHRQKKK